jgi:hypothetical protein
MEPFSEPPQSHPNVKCPLSKCSLTRKSDKPKDPLGTSVSIRTLRIQPVTSTTSRGAHRIPLGLHVSTRRTLSKVVSLQPKSGPLHTHVPHHGRCLDRWVSSCLNSQLHPYVLSNEVHTSAQLRFRDPLIMCIRVSFPLHQVLLPGTLTNLPVSISASANDLHPVSKDHPNLEGYPFL